MIRKKEFQLWNHESGTLSSPMTILDESTKGTEVFTNFAVRFVSHNAQIDPDWRQFNFASIRIQDKWTWKFQMIKAEKRSYNVERLLRAFTFVDPDKWNNNFFR